MPYKPELIYNSVRRNWNLILNLVRSGSYKLIGYNQVMLLFRTCEDHTTYEVFYGRIHCAKRNYSIPSNIKTNQPTKTTFHKLIWTPGMSRQKIIRAALLSFIVDCPLAFIYTENKTTSCSSQQKEKHFEMTVHMLVKTEGTILSHCCSFAKATLPLLRSANIYGTAVFSWRDWHDGTGFLDNKVSSLSLCGNN